MAEKPSAKTDTKVELRGDREIVIERTFRAPPRVVFEAWTNPDFVRRWWAPKSMGAEMSEVRADVRAGGTYRYVTRAGDQELAFSGTYSEVTPPSRLVYTMFFEPMKDAGASVVTVTFEARGEHTHVVSHEVYPSAEARQAAVASGMEDGLRVTYDQLDELVVEMHTTR
ncbi:MAG: SRPBCC family protein [Labilithrix sp.]|nr:SRPBCC family protein [Labilithrix sp.]MCW5813045.1 SRPBCC family protein [Labilithrix sp.]